MLDGLHAIQNVALGSVIIRRTACIMHACMYLYLLARLVLTCFHFLYTKSPSKDSN